MAFSSGDHAWESVLDATKRLRRGAAYGMAVHMAARCHEVSEEQVAEGLVRYSARCAAKLMREGVPGGLAIHRASKYYRVTEDTIVRALSRG